jgi:hypothetical protein
MINIIIININDNLLKNTKHHIILVSKLYFRDIISSLQTEN